MSTWGGFVRPRVLSHTRARSCTHAHTHPRSRTCSRTCTIGYAAVWANYNGALAPLALALTLHSPFPPCRCIFELFHTVKAGNQFEIVLPKSEQARFIDALTKTSGVAQNVFANLRIENAKAYEKKDEVMIMGKVDASAGGRREVSGHAKVNI